MQKPDEEGQKGKSPICLLLPECKEEDQNA